MSVERKIIDVPKKEIVEQLVKIVKNNRRLLCRVLKNLETDYTDLSEYEDLDIILDGLSSRVEE